MITTLNFWVGFGLGTLTMFVAMEVLTLWILDKRRGKQNVIYIKHFKRNKDGNIHVEIP